MRYVRPYPTEMIQCDSCQHEEPSFALGFVDFDYCAMCKKDFCEECISSNLSFCLCNQCLEKAPEHIKEICKGPLYDESYDYKRDLVYGWIESQRSDNNEKEA